MKHHPNTITIDPSSGIPNARLESQRARTVVAPFVAAQTLPTTKLCVSDASSLAEEAGTVVPDRYSWWTL